MIIRQILRGLVTMGFLIFYVLYQVNPGWHRAATPVAYGLTQIGPNTFTDSPQRKLQLTRMVEIARKNSQKFFGVTDTNPRFILCTTEACKKNFDIRSSGVAVLSHVVLISPRGMNEMILTHEMIHIDLHSHFGISDLRKRRFPSWFDEGLASFLSERDRFKAPREMVSQKRIMMLETPLDWRNFVAQRGWAASYGQARRIVERIHLHLGDEGLLDLVLSVQNIDDFDGRVREILERPLPRKLPQITQ